MSRTFKRVADGIYKSEDHFYHRPIKPDGKRTWRALDGVTLKAAKANYARLKGTGPESDLTIGSAVHIYREAGCPDKRRQERAGKYLSQERSRCDTLSKYWAEFQCSALTNAALDDYADWRMKRARANGWDHGGRAVDLDIVTLRHVMRWAVRKGLLSKDPFVEMEVGTYRKLKVRHCRELAPASGDELHDLAANLFESTKSQTMGWMTLITAMVGFRVSEMAGLRIKAIGEEPGSITGHILWVTRKKNGANNFFEIHPELRVCLDHFFAWRQRQKRLRTSPWWFPGFVDPKQPVKECSLTHALQREAYILGIPPRTAHGLRSFYVTVRRGQGASDAQIALETGQISGGREIVKTYGDAKPVKLSWMPTEGEPAWANVVPKYTQTQRIRQGSKEMLKPDFARASRRKMAIHGDGGKAIN